MGNKDQKDLYKQILEMKHTQSRLSVPGSSSKPSHRRKARARTGADVLSFSLLVHSRFKLLMHPCV